RPRRGGRPPSGCPPAHYALRRYGATGGVVDAIRTTSGRIPSLWVLSAGIPGRGHASALQEGAREVRIHGQSIRVRATVVTLDGFSAHADRDEILRWLAGFQRAPLQVYVVHGEPQASDSLAATLRARLGWNARVPED